MIAVDSSALVAILFDEPEGPAFRADLRIADRVVLSATSLVETAMVVVGRLGPAGIGKLDLLLAEYRVVVTAFDLRQALAAQTAFVRYGKGRHPAGLNFGDCLAYGLAKALGLPLLHKGTDFAATDLPA